MGDNLVIVNRVKSLQKLTVRAASEWLLEWTLPWIMEDQNQRMYMLSKALDRQLNYEVFDELIGPLLHSIAEEKPLFVDMLVPVLCGRLVRIVNFEDWSPIIRPIALHSFTNMQNLRCLRLDSTITSRDIIYLLNGLESMPHLRVFQMSMSTTDLVIKYLGMYCKQLKKLDVAWSPLVTDSCAPYIARMSNLRYLHLYQTAISVRATAFILQYLHNLEDLGICHEFADVLSTLFESGIALQLRKVVHPIQSERGLFMMKTVCPRMSTVWLDLRHMYPNITVIQQLRNLRELTLSYSNVCDNVVNKMITELGKYITNINFIETRTISEQVLITLDKVCPLLTKLSLQDCVFMRTDYIAPRQSIFNNLKKLCMSNNYPEKYLRFLLYNCTYLEELSLANLSRNNTGRLILEAVSAGALLHIEDIYLPGDEDWTLEEVRQLLQRRPNLHNLNYVRRWANVAPNFRDLLKFIDTLNLQVRIGW